MTKLRVQFCKKKSTILEYNRALNLPKTKCTELHLYIEIAKIPTGFLNNGNLNKFYQLMPSSFSFDEFAKRRKNLSRIVKHDECDTRGFNKKSYM